MFTYDLIKKEDNKVKDVFIVKVSGTYDDEPPAVRETVFSRNKFTPEVMELIYMVGRIDCEMLNEISYTDTTLRNILPRPPYNEISEYETPVVTYVDEFGNHHDVLIKIDFTGDEWSF